MTKSRIGRPASWTGDAARIYGLMGTANLNGLDPVAHLRYVLEGIAWRPIIRVEDPRPGSGAVMLFFAPGH